MKYVFSSHITSILHWLVWLIEGVYCNMLEALLSRQVVDDMLKEGRSCMLVGMICSSLKPPNVMVTRCIVEGAQHRVPIVDDVSLPPRHDELEVHLF